MVQLSTLLSLGLSASSLVAAAPAVAPVLVERATCTFTGSTGAAAVVKAKKSCPVITLNNLVVPAGTTLDLTGLTKGTRVSPTPPILEFLSS